MSTPSTLGLQPRVLSLAVHCRFHKIPFDSSQATLILSTLFLSKTHFNIILLHKIWLPQVVSLFPSSFPTKKSAIFTSPVLHAPPILTSVISSEQKFHCSLLQPLKSERVREREMHFIHVTQYSDNRWQETAKCSACPNFRNSCD